MENSKIEKEKQEMIFKRILAALVLLLVGFIVAFAIVEFNSRHYYQNEYLPVDEKCNQYLYSMSDTWKKQDDGWYLSYCDLNNDYSDNSVHYEAYLKRWDDSVKAFNFIFWVIATIPLSFFVRWLLTSRTLLNFKRTKVVNLVKDKPEKVDSQNHPKEKTKSSKGAWLIFVLLLSFAMFGTAAFDEVAPAISYAIHEIVGIIMLLLALWYLVSRKGNWDALAWILFSFCMLFFIGIIASIILAVLTM